MNFLKGLVINVEVKKNVLSATLEELNPELFLNPVFQSYYLKLFYDVELDDGMRGFHTPTSHIFSGLQEQAKIVCEANKFSISYVNYFNKIGRFLEVQQGENESILIHTRYVFPHEGLIYHLVETQVLKDNQIYPVHYQYTGFDEHLMDEKDYQKDWVYQSDFVSKMKENGVIPSKEYAHNHSNQSHQTVTRG